VNADVIDIAEYLEGNTSDQLINKAVSDGAVEGAIVQLNTFGQLGRFEDSTGEKLADIGGEYSTFTQEAKGLGPREVNLEDTGDYWESFEVNPINGDGYEISSDPIKTGGDNLENRWGKNLEGLNKENIKKANDIIEAKIWAQAEKAL